MGRIWMGAVISAAMMAQSGGGVTPVIQVSRSLVSVPAAMAPGVAPYIGALVVVQTTAGWIGKVEVRLDYRDENGRVREMVRTVSRRQTRGGYDPSPIPMLFGAPMESIEGVYVDGFSSTPAEQENVQ